MKTRCSECDSNHIKGSGAGGLMYMSCDRCGHSWQFEYGELADRAATNATLRAELVAKDAEIARLLVMTGTRWLDKPLPEDAEIMAAHPMHSADPNCHKRYGEAMRLVGARHSKYALVDPVNWLLPRTALDPTR